MADIRIRYDIEDESLDKSIQKWAKLDKESQDVIKDFRSVNNEAQKAGKSIETAASKGSDSLKKTSKEAKNLKKDVTDLNKTISTVGQTIVAYFSVSALVEFGKAVVARTAEFQKFQAVLTNTLGSRQLADATLGVLQEFAKTTPFQLNEITGAYVKLANQGFKPTAQQLRALGDLASSTGKSFDQLAEAVIDAQTGEFERLKEFGIRAAKDGDKVKFTFKGVTTTVNSTNEAIREYITSLGQAAGVSGSMAAQSATLGGAISNLEDSWDQLLTAIGQKFGDTLTKSFTALGDFLNGVKELLETTNDQINKNISDGIINISQANDDYYKTRIDQLIKAGKKESEIVQTLQDEQVQSTVALFKRQDQLREQEAAKRAQLTKSTVGIEDGATTERVIEVIDALSLSSVAIEEYKKILGDLKLVDFAIEEGNKNLTKSQDLVSAAFAKSAEEAVKLSKENDKHLKEKLDLLAKEEELAVRKAKLEIESAEESGREVLRINSLYTQKREELIRNFGKQNENIGKENALRQQEIFKEQSEYEVKIFNDAQDQIKRDRESRAKENLSAIDEINNAKLGSDQKFYNQQIQNERDAFTRGEISLEQYYENIEQIEYNSQRNRLNALIKADQDKLKVQNVSAEEILKINQDIVDKTKELNDLEFKAHEDKEKKKTEKTLEEAEKRKQIEQDAFNLFVESLNTVFDIQSNRRANDLNELNSETEQRIKLAGDNAAAKERINAEADAKEKEIKRRQAIADRNQALFNIGIITAQNIVKALGQPPIPGTNFISAGIAAALGAVQVAAVLSRPIPKFAKGTKRVTGGVKGIDSVPAILMPDERVFTATQSRGPMAGILDAIQDNRIKKPVDILKHVPLDFTRMRGTADSGMITEIKGLRKELKNLKQVNMTFDKNGFNSFIQRSNSKTQFMNNYFNA